MATYQARIEALTGISLTTTSTPTLDEVTQFLIDGVRDFTDNYLKVFPGEGNPFVIESGEYTSKSLTTDLDSPIIVSVVRESGTNDDWRICRKSFPGMETVLQDKNSMHYASKINPAYIQTGDTITVFPVPNASGDNGYKIFYINNNPVADDGALTYSSSTIRYFPEHKDRYIVAYAAMKAIEAKMADYTIEEEDPELMTSLSTNLQMLRQEYYSAFGSQQQGGGDEG